MPSPGSPGASELHLYRELLDQPEGVLWGSPRWGAMPFSILSHWPLGMPSHGLYPELTDL